MGFLFIGTNNDLATLILSERCISVLQVLLCMAVLLKGETTRRCLPSLPTKFEKRRWQTHGLFNIGLG